MQLQTLHTEAESRRLLRMVRHERTPPDPARLIMALRQIGYSFDHAIADLIDNSINARASTVLVRFICSGDQIRSVVVADDGGGMDEGQLHNAMRFGSERDLDPSSLGKYGMGLKLASLSHARRLTVITRRATRVSARRWTINGIEQGWKCEVLTADGATTQLDASWGVLNLATDGTLVIWDDLDKLATSSSGLRATVRLLATRLQTHLGLCFHRFIENRTLAIYLDQQTEGQAERSIRVDVTPLNPFAYPVPGNPFYPKTFRTKVAKMGTLSLEAHIWPPNSELPQYRLGNKAAARQGFYFYRNGRLIQSGGWNGLVQHDSEPHGSLARTKIDLPPELDSAFGLNVQKSAVIVPPGFDLAVALARTDDGDTFDAYRRAAQQVYRRQDSRAAKSLPLIPRRGLPKKLGDTAEALLAPTRTRIRKVSFEWKELATGEVFQLDRHSRTIYLNRTYRKVLLAGRHPHKVDLPLFKVMLFLLTADDFDSERVSGQQKRRLDFANALLAHAATLAKG